MWQESDQKSGKPVSKFIPLSQVSFFNLVLLDYWHQGLPLLLQRFLHSHLKRAGLKPGPVVYTCNPSTWKSEAREWQIWGQPELHSKTLSPKQNKQTKRLKSVGLVGPVLISQVLKPWVNPSPTPSDFSELMLRKT
jgi:hypothetical protein